MKKEITYKKISDLIPYHNNPRINEGAINHVASSIKEFNFQNPIVIDEFNVIVCGHTRLKAAIKLGLVEVPCIKADDLTPAQTKAFRIADNKTNEFSIWDFPLLGVELQELKELDFDYDFGFDDDISAPEKDGLTDEDYIPEEAEPICQTGDLWQLGEHRLLCGDATSKDDVERLMGGKKADVTFTSPPYNAGDNALGGNKKMKKQKYLHDSDDKDEDEYLKLISDVQSNVMEHSIYQFINIQSLAGNKKSVIKFCNNFVDNFADVIIWNKGGGQPAAAKNVMNSRFEYIFIFKNETDPKRSIDTANFHGTISNVYELNPSGKNKNHDIHAAVFPVEFAEFIVSNFSRIKSIVIDPYLGSGTTIIACEKTNRKCYGMEIDPHYCDVIIKRWEEYTGNKAVKI